MRASTDLLDRPALTRHAVRPATVHRLRKEEKRVSELLVRSRADERLAWLLEVGHLIANEGDDLYGVALERLPTECTKVAWLDCDVLFDSPLWAHETTELLDTHTVVQPFGTVVRLPRDAVLDNGRGKRWLSFGSVYKVNPDLAASGLFEPHGHTGFAWAARRTFLEAVGLYDVCIAGSADHLMAHAFAGNVENDCVLRMVGAEGTFREHYLRWASPGRPSRPAKTRRRVNDDSPLFGLRATKYLATEDERNTRRIALLLDLLGAERHRGRLSLDVNCVDGRIPDERLRLSARESGYGPRSRGCEQKFSRSRAGEKYPRLLRVAR